MKSTSHRESFVPTAAPSFRTGFSIVELLIVIGIIGILASLILPAIMHSKIDAQKKQARQDIDRIVTAIAGYESTYNRYPVSTATLALATAQTDDFTYGDSALQAALGNGTWTANNSEVVAILMDAVSYPNGTPTANANHEKNAQQKKFLVATPGIDPKDPGVGPDLVYRDPWGNPYIISLDLNYDGKCRDAFYKLKTVSQQTPGSGIGFNGLINSRNSAGPDSDYFEFSGGMMVWSLGPDKQANANSANSPDQKANASFNRDNIVSWK